MQVRSQVVDPELGRPRLFVGGGFAVKKEDVRLHALRVKNAGGQAQQGVDVGLLEQFAPDRFASAAFEEHVVRHHYRGATVLLEDGEDMLQEVELLVRGRSPEVVSVDDERFFARLARLVDDGHAALLAEGWVGQHQLIFAVLARERVLYLHRHVRRVAPDAVQHQVHAAEPRDAVHQFNAAELLGVEETKLRLVEFVMPANKIVRREQETARAASRIADHLAGPRLHHLHDRLDQRAGVKYWPAPPFTSSAFFCRSPS